MGILSIGDVGAISRITVWNIRGYSGAEEMIAVDHQKKESREYGGSFKNSRIKGNFVDALARWRSQLRLMAT